MPVMHFEVQWPDTSKSLCYSPSLVIKDYLKPGQTYPIKEFTSLTREALNIASERVRAKYGFACSAAMDQLATIEANAEKFSGNPSATVVVLSFQD